MLDEWLQLDESTKIPYTLFLLPPIPILLPYHSQSRIPWVLWDVCMGPAYQFRGTQSSRQLRLLYRMPSGEDFLPVKTWWWKMFIFWKLATWKAKESPVFKATGLLVLGVSSCLRKRTQKAFQEIPKSLILKNEKVILSGGFRWHLFSFYTPYMGRWSNLTSIYFSNGLVQPPTRRGFFWKFMQTPHKLPLIFCRSEGFKRVNILNCYLVFTGE